jgi:hypothetical protein
LAFSLEYKPAARLPGFSIQVSGQYFFACLAKQADSRARFRKHLAYGFITSCQAAFSYGFALVYMKFGLCRNNVWLVLWRGLFLSPDIQ